MNEVPLYPSSEVGGRGGESDGEGGGSKSSESSEDKD